MSPLSGPRANRLIYYALDRSTHEIMRCNGMSTTIPTHRATCDLTAHSNRSTIDTENDGSDRHLDDDSDSTELVSMVPMTALGRCISSESANSFADYDRTHIDLAAYYSTPDMLFISETSLDYDDCSSGSSIVDIEGEDSNSVSSFSYEETECDHYDLDLDSLDMIDELENKLSLGHQRRVRFSSNVTVRRYRACATTLTGSDTLQKTRFVPRSQPPQPRLSAKQRVRRE
jgi:hypothetical protein